MLPIVDFQGNLVQLKKTILGKTEKDIMLKDTIGKIEEIKININNNCGILIKFSDGKTIYKPTVKSYISWLRKHFKLYL